MMQQKLERILTEFNVDLKDSTPIFRQINSIALVEMILRLEQEFHFEISPLEYDQNQFRDFQSLSDLIRAKMGKS